MIHKTVMREGFGNLIAEGMYSLAKIIGQGAINYCYHVKGSGRGVYPAGLFSLAHAIATRGADHLRGRSWAVGDNSDEDVVKELVAEGIISNDPVQSIIHGERVITLADCIGRCKGAVNTWTCALPLAWRGSLFEGLAELLTKATGQPTRQSCERLNIVEIADRLAEDGPYKRWDGPPLKVLNTYPRSGKRF